MKYRKKYEAEVAQFVSVCHRLADLGYVTSQGGNLAQKLEDDLLIITPTQLYKGWVEEKDVVFIDLDGNLVEGKHKPTGETPMYLNFYRERPDIVSALHCHPPKVNAFAIAQGMNWLMRPLFPEPTTEIGPVPVVPYAEPLTKELADNFLPYLQKYNAFLMENHGLVMLSTCDILWSMHLTEMLEATAESILWALAIGEIKEISREGVENLDRTMRTRNLPLFGAPGVNNSLIDLYYT